MLSALKNFGITFGIAAVVFGLVAYWVVGLITSSMTGMYNEEESNLNSIISGQDKTETTEAVETEDPEIDYVIPEGDSFTALLIVTDYRPETYSYYPADADIDKIVAAEDGSVGILSSDYRGIEAKYIVLIRVDKESREYTFTPIPTITSVYTQSGEHTLEDIYYMYGQSYFLEKISAMTGIGIDYPIVLNITDAPSIIEQIGTFKINLPDSIYTNGKDYVVMPAVSTETTDSTTTVDKDKANAEETYKITVNSGNVTVGKDNIIPILLFENYEDGIDERNKIVSDIAEGIIGRFADMEDESIINTFDKIKGKLTTNLTSEILSEKCDLIQIYNKFAVNTINIPGNIIGGSASSVPIFTIDTSSVVNFFNEYRMAADPLATAK